MKRPLLLLLAAATAALLALPAAALGTALPAFAVQAVAHGQGVFWAKDHTSWIGDYELDDGRSGYCIDVEKPPPTGADIEYSDGSESGWFSADDSARLAYLSRHWGSPGDPLTAAAGQLATWTVTGLAGHDQAYFAQRANADADLVLDAANHMLALANGTNGASRGASVAIALTLDGATGSARPDLTVDYLSGPVVLPIYSYPGTMTLHGATFADGSRSAKVANGATAHFTADQKGATESVTVEVSYPNLPYGDAFRLGRNTAGSQNLLVSQPPEMEVRASATASGPSGLPFRPRVQTTTSTQVAEPGATLTDDLHLEVHPASPTGTQWGVYRAHDGSMDPIPVVIQSVLYGPFPTRPAESADVPGGAPEVCRVELTVEGGPGDYRSNPCVVPTAGYYVWTDLIDPVRTPTDRGGGRLQGWRSAFGVASETTVVPAVPRIETVASAHDLSAAGCVSDSLTVNGFPAGAPAITVISTLIGPLPDAPTSETTPQGWEEFPVAGRVSTLVDHDGIHRSDCVRVHEAGHYYFVYSSQGSGPTVPKVAAGSTGDDDGEDGTAAEPEVDASLLALALIPPFSDAMVHDAESVSLTAPKPPTSTPPPPMPPTSTPPAPTVPPSPSPSAVPPIPPSPSVSSTPAPVAALASTGRSIGLSALATTWSVLAVIAGLAGLGLTARRWR